RLREGKLPLLDLTVDQGLMRVKERAAAELLPGQPELAPIVAGALHHASFSTERALIATLHENGHSKLAAEALRDIFPSATSEKMMRTFEGVAYEVDDALVAIAELAEPAATTAVQR